MSQVFNTIIQLGIIAPGHVREVVDGLNATDKRVILPLMAKVKLTGSKWFYTQMEMQTTTYNNDVSL